MALLHLWTALLLTCSANTHLITPAARLPATPTPSVSKEGSGDELEKDSEHQVLKRDALPLTCDGTGIFTCPVGMGTCYTGLDGFIGCCSVSNCVPRTTCIEWLPSVTTSINADTAGFMYCSNPALPLCNTISNALMDQYIIWCDSTGTSKSTEYRNPVTTGSMAKSFAPSFNSAMLFPSTTSGEQSQTSTATPSPSVVTVISTPTLAATSSAATLSTVEDESTKAQAQKEHDSTPHGTIVGIACGATAGGMLLLAALWYFRRNRKNAANTRDGGEKDASLASGPTRPNSNSNDSSIAKSNSLSPIDTNSNGLVSRFPGHPNKFSNIGSPTGSAVEFGSLQRYTVTNPDLNSPTETAGPSPVEAPTEREERSTISLASPLVGATTRDSSVSALWPTPARTSSQTYTPYTPSNYQPSAPDSVIRTSNLQPPSLPQPYSTATFASDSSYRPQAPYTPSNYQPEAPDSIHPALRPPVLPQEYSAATFASGSTMASSPPYRGLSDGGAPWDYLSAESAMGGGWKNEGPPPSPPSRRER